MSIDMYVSKSKAQEASTSSVCQHHVEGYAAIQQAISQFTLSSPLLMGKAYESAKAFYSAVLYPLVQAGILLSEATGKAVKEFPERYQSEVDSGDLKQSELEEKIREVDQLITQTNDIHHMLTSSSLTELDRQNQILLNRGLLDTYQTEKKELEEKLQKLVAFNASSPTLFSEITSLKQAIDQGLAQTRTAWNSQAGTFVIPSNDDLEWVNRIQEIQARKSEQEGADSQLKGVKDVGISVMSGTVVGVAGNEIENSLTGIGARRGAKESLSIWQNRYSIETADGAILGKVPGATQALRESTEQSAVNLAGYSGKALSEGAGLLVGVGIDMWSGDSAEEAWGKEIVTATAVIGTTGLIEAGSAALVSVGVLANPIGVGVVGAVAIGVGIGLANDWTRDHFQGVKDFEDNIGEAVVSRWNNVKEGAQGLFGSIF
ncbi:hypothetical protein MFLO_05330 [Listeria floridensis FSL S10-1187]|uniref:LXG domain-containing protein n=1 Tax=Listeria floridensis FSL S10-1187 TaxID=1265817 RepID=A0ABP3B0G4_9LIST|nr:T7SS effector LXG polymorphic toxin [Listeria floridensis]EUJ33009.1 hypothetical protein MFLO_05330 [Listeria floridensis FSL S10-1187]